MFFDSPLNRATGVADAVSRLGVDLGSEWETVKADVDARVGRATYWTAGNYADDPTSHVLALVDNPDDSKARAELDKWALANQTRMLGLYERARNHAAKPLVDLFHASVGGWIDQMTPGFEEAVNGVCLNAQIIESAGGNVDTIKDSLSKFSMDVIHAWADLTEGYRKVNAYWGAMLSIHRAGGLGVGVGLQQIGLDDVPLIACPTTRGQFQSIQPTSRIDQVARAGVTMRLAHPDTWPVESRALDALGIPSEHERQERLARAKKNLNALRSAYWG